MRLTSFEVQGFKNLVEPVRLEGLDTINVVHGENGVGKSNLLQAMELFFFVFTQRLPSTDPRYELPVGGAQARMPGDWLATVGFPPGEIFNRESPRPILMQADVAMDPEDLEDLREEPRKRAFEALRVALEVRWTGKDGILTVQRLETADGRDLGKGTPGAEEIRDIALAATLLSWRRRVASGFGPAGFGPPALRVTRIPAERLDVLGSAHPLLFVPRPSEGSSAPTCKRFVEVMSAFADILGGAEGHSPELLWETAEGRDLLRRLGSGAQQIAAIFVRMFASGASIVTIEEPELNLGGSLQRRLRDALRDLVGKDGAPTQIFLTSHSGAFDSGDTFYLMEREAGGHPSVRRAPVRDLPRVLLGVAG